MHVRSGDNVLVTNGRERGKSGQITKVLREKNRVIVGGVNLVKRHTKPRPGVMQGGIIQKEAAIHASNVQLICPSCNRPTRTGHRFEGEGDNTHKVRFCKHCGEAIPEIRPNR